MSVAYLVLGVDHFRAVYLEREKAMQSCVEHHGTVRPLCYESEVAELVNTAYRAGLDERLLRVSH